MTILRIYQKINTYLKPNKVLIIYGPRQVGKTTLLQGFLPSTPLKYRFDSGEDIRIQEILGSNDFKKLLEYASGYELIVIDEAQKVPNIGQGLKILVDQVPGIKIIATGSSSFELAGQVGEPLTGRKITLTLLPISQIELNVQYNHYDLKNRLEEYLVYGCYPEVLTTADILEKKRVLNEIVGSYLLKDILELDKVKSSKILLDLIRLLAFQIGHEVSLTELGQQLGIDYKTVARYLDLLEKAFVLFNVRGFSRNLRKEIVKKSKYYFYDIGVRNAVIANFNDLNLRNDVGALWENFLVMERLKKQNYQALYTNNFFWRTWNQAEIDWVEERNGKLFGYEFKWGQKQVKAPRLWHETYPQAGYQVIDQENYLEFVL